MTGQKVPRAAIIGISGYGRIHLELARAAAAAGTLELGAAVVINPAQEAENMRALAAGGCRIYDDYAAMLAAEAGRLDLCLIPTGIAWHARMTAAALAAGANVLVEKPLAGSVAEGEAIIAAAARADRFVAVGFQDIYEPVAQQLKRQLVAGAIGRVRRVRFLGLWPRPPGYFQRNNWAGRLHADGVPVLDSPLNNAFAHFVNLALFLAGREFATGAVLHEVEAVLWRTNAIESFDTGVVRGTTPDGVRLWLGASHACAVTREPEIVIEGERGRAVWRHEQDCRLEPAAGPAVRWPLPTTAGTRTAMMQAVLARLRDPSAMICGPELALGHTRLIEAAHAAAAIGPAPGAVEPQPIPAGREPVLRAREIEARLFRAFDEDALPAAGALTAAARA